MMASKTSIENERKRADGLNQLNHLELAPPLVLASFPRKLPRIKRCLFDPAEEHRDHRKKGKS